MHDSLLENVKFYLDENEYYSSEYYSLKGWVFCEDEEIQDIKIRLSSTGEYPNVSAVFPLGRDDVAEFYPDFKKYSSYSGFKISFRPDIEDDIEFLVKINDNWSVCKEIKIMPNRIILNEPISKVNKTAPSLVVIDDFYTDPIKVRELALSLDYSPSGYHKGKRTAVKYIIDGTREKIEQVLGKKIHNWSSQPYNGVFQYCTPEDPVVYHYDSQRYAAVVFLTPNAPPETGTSFYRHRKETWLTKAPADYPIWKSEEQLNAVTQAIMGNEDIDFLDRTKWEEVDRIGNKFNRFAMWDARLIHSATSYFGKSIENGRLFHMFFFDAY